MRHPHRFVFFASQAARSEQSVFLPNRFGLNEQFIERWMRAVGGVFG